MRVALYLSCLCFLVGCLSAPKGYAPSISSGFGLNAASDISQADPMLSGLGGWSTIAGIIALVITRGSMGLRAVVIGIGLVLLNQAIARYGDWLFIPTLAASGAISLSYAYLTIRRMVRLKKENKQ